MSGPLLVGIAAVGTVWVLGCRARANAPVAAGLAPKPATPAPPPTDSAAQIAGGVEGNAGTAVIGGDTTIGVCGGGSTATVSLQGDGGVVVDHNASRGGADPSTLTSTIGTNVLDDDTRTAMVDPAAMWIQASRGSTEGLTRQQVARLYEEAYYYTGDVAL